MKKNVVIIGAGPAGLGAAHELTLKKNNYKITILDKNEIVGGLARTHSRKGFHFDVGPHRFFTKNREVLALWKNTLGKDFKLVPRLTRMYYKGRFFMYPVEFTDIIRKFGIVELIQSTLSYIYAKIFLRNLDPKTFEEWITKNFGFALYKIFFKTYTEKVWGVPCHEIGAEWAGQRIKNTNFTEVIKNALSIGKPKAKTWIDKFYYPTRGAGYMYEKLAAKLKRRGVTILLDSQVVKINHKNKKITSVEYRVGNRPKIIKADAVFSSMPITHLVQFMSPSAPKEVINSSKRLTFRDHITVNFIVRGSNLFPDNWIYIHDPEYQMARVANYNNFTPKMSRDNKHTAISVEYFVFKTDKLWKANDEEIKSLAEEEITRAGLLKESQTVGGFVVRESESYPTYYLKQKKHFDTLKSFSEKMNNLYLIGRGGMFKYNNMDHSIYSGMLAARNLIAGKQKYNVWAINEDAEYLEEK